MPRTPRALGWEEIRELDVDELIKEYNRVADRINRRISRAGGVAKTGQQRVQPIRSKAAVARFRAAYAAGGSERQKLQGALWRAERRGAEPTVKQAMAGFKFDLKRAIRQTFMGQHLHGDYKGQWIDDLSPEALASLYWDMKPIIDTNEQFAGQGNAFWYLYRRAHMIGAEVKPITDEASFREAMSTVKNVMAVQQSDLAALDPSARLAAVSEKIVYGGL